MYANPSAIITAGDNDVQGFAASSGSADLDTSLDRMKALPAGFGKVDWNGAFQGCRSMSPAARTPRKAKNARARRCNRTAASRKENTH